MSASPTPCGYGGSATAPTPRPRATTSRSLAQRRPSAQSSGSTRDARVRDGQVSAVDARVVHLERDVERRRDKTGGAARMDAVVSGEVNGERRLAVRQGQYGVESK
jgi:hypothetical protein